MSAALPLGRGDPSSLALAFAQYRLGLTKRLSSVPLGGQRHTACLTTY